MVGPQRISSSAPQLKIPAWVERLVGLALTDPGNRGIGLLARDGGLRPTEELFRAALLLGQNRGEVVIVTGFPVVTDKGVRPETDGPPGAVLLGAVLRELGWQVVLVAEPPHSDALSAIVAELKLTDLPIVCWNSELNAPPWPTSARGKQPRVLIAIERPGPSWEAPPLLEDGTEDPVFAEVVPAEHRGQLHSFRGSVITSHCAPIHEWFRCAGDRGWHTIGVGDGGNEIGFGRIPWRALQTTIANGAGGLIACAIPVECLVLASVSNWGAYALGIAAACEAGRPDAARWISPEMDYRAVRAAVEQAGAVDGVTGRPALRVDGLPPEVHGDFLTRAWRVVSDAVRG